MALAETAELVATLKLRDQLSGPAKAAAGSVRGLERAAASGSRSVARAEGGMSRLGRTAGLLGTKLGHAKQSLTGLLTGPLGIVGLGAGLFGLGDFFSKSIEKAKEFGDASYRLSKLIGLPVESASRLVHTLDKFGVAGDAQIRLFGLYEKGVERLVGTQKKAIAFQKAYGFSLVDSKGKQVDANEALKRAADYFTSSASASSKATLLSKLYGRSWQQLIPLLAQGRKGIEKEEASSLHLSAAQIKQIASLRGAQREFNDTLGNTQTLAGLTLLPLLTKLARVANSFLSNNQQGIVQFFKDGADAAMKIGGAINSTVVPAIKAIAGAWSALPEPLRNVLIGGFVANKITGKIFGTSLVGAAKSLLGGAGGLLSGKGLFGRGNSPASPLYVQAVGAGGLGGPAGGALPGKGGSRVAGAISALALVGEIASVIATQQQVSEQNSAQAAEIASTQKAWLRKSPSAADLQRGLAGVEQGINDLRSNPLNVLVQGDALAKLEGMRADLKAQIALLTRPPIKGTNVPALAGHADERNRREALTEPKLRAAVTTGASIANRNLPQRRDLNDTGFRITSAVRALEAGVVATERSGFAIVVSALWAVQAAVKGIPSIGGTAIEQGRGTGPDGRPKIVNPAGARVGIEKNRSLNLSVTTQISARENTHATTSASRYGQNATQAGAR